MTTSLDEGTVLDRLMIRERLEMYLRSLDDQDWDGIASCFTEDCVARYNHEPQTIHGGRGIAQRLHRMAAYDTTNHLLNNVRVEIKGDRAVAHSLVIATLHQGQQGADRVQERASDYVDDLIKRAGTWGIERRLHKPTMQHDALSQTMVLCDGKA